MVIRTCVFPVNIRALPKVLYDTEPYRAGTLGLVVPNDVREELHVFIKAYLVFCGYGQDGVYLRLDLFVDPKGEMLQVIEINARFVDGWGSALNLNRLAGIQVNSAELTFPRFWHLPSHNKRYRPEFDLARRELALCGITTEELRDRRRTSGQMYYYAWDEPNRSPASGIVPAYGYELENKIQLARFALEWTGKRVQVPFFYFHPEVPWEEIPKNQVIFKFCETGSHDSQVAGKSVMYPNEIGKGSFARECYTRGTLIAQELANALTEEGRQCQVVVLTCGDRPITGYALWADEGTRAINDASVHGPLVFQH